MAAEKKNILTYEGLKKLEEELEDLKVVRRKEVADKIKEAREQGDLSENAEYDAAKDETVYTFVLLKLTNIGSVLDFKGALLIILINSVLVLTYLLWVRARKRHWVLKILFIVSEIALSMLGVGAILGLLCSVKYAFELGLTGFASLVAIVAFLSYCYSSKTIRKWLSKRLFV